MRKRTALDSHLAEPREDAPHGVQQHRRGGAARAAAAHLLVVKVRHEPDGLLGRQRVARAARAVRQRAQRRVARLPTSLQPASNQHPANRQKEKNNNNKYEHPTTNQETENPKCSNDDPKIMNKL